MLVAVIVVLLIIAAAVLYARRGGAGPTSSDRVEDGSTLTFTCGAGEVPDVVDASYGPLTAGACATIDVTAPMRQWVAANPGAAFTVGPTNFAGVDIPACPSARVLAITYRCAAAPRQETLAPRRETIIPHRETIIPHRETIIPHRETIIPHRETIIPHRVNTCSSAQDVLPAAMSDPDPLLHAWTGQDNKNFTAAIVPWDPDSKIQLTAGALTAGTRQMYRPINPLTRVGITDQVLNWDNPYADTGGVMDISASPCSSAVSIFELQPFQPGFLTPKANDSTDGTMFESRTYYQPPYWSRAAGPYGGPYRPVASCPEDLGIDTDLQAGDHGVALMEHMEGHPSEFWWQTTGGDRAPWSSDRVESNLAQLVGVGGSTYVQPPRREPAFVIPRETLRSRGPGAPARRETLRSRDNYREVAVADECLSGIGCGLGSTWIDSRFEPGPQEMYYGGDAIWAHGGHAGGPTFGSFTPFVFQAGGSWDRYVHGFGDGSYVAPRAPPGFKVSL